MTEGFQIAGSDPSEYRKRSAAEAEVHTLINWRNPITDDYAEDGPGP
jgi:hypothetical protein